MRVPAKTAGTRSAVGAGDESTVRAARSGTEPAGSLWALLTPDEQSFFTKMDALGPLTYRAKSESGESPAPPIGQRIDVKG
jgi:hypothetical protein